MGHQRVLGVDGCRAGRVVASSDSDLGNVDFRLVPNLSGVCDDAKTGKVMAVIDIPIGLPEASPRQCDTPLNVAPQFLFRQGHISAPGIRIGHG